MNNLRRNNNKRMKMENKKKIIGGATTTATNPLKKEVGSTSGLDFANQVGALLAQPTTIKMIPPDDETRPSTKPEKISTGVKTESKKVLHPKSNIYDTNMQSRRSFTFEYDASFHHPRFSKAMIHLSVKVVTAPTAGAGGGAGYNQYATTDADGTLVPSTYGPIIYPNRLPDFFFKKATIELRGGIAIEPTSQTHQETKLVKFYTTTTPEAVEAKYSNMGGYFKDYDSTNATQKFQVPVRINATTGVMEPIPGNDHDYRRISQTHFIEGTAGEINRDFRYTTKGAAALSDKFNNGAEVHFQIPLRRICKYAQCDQMSPSEKDYYITLHKMRESFLFTCQRSTVHQNIMFQITNCEIHVPIVELSPEKKKRKWTKSIQILELLTS